MKVQVPLGTKVPYLSIFINIQLPAVRFHKFHETSALIALLSTTLTDILPNVLQLRLISLQSTRQTS